MSRVLMKYSTDCSGDLAGRLAATLNNSLKWPCANRRWVRPALRAGRMFNLDRRRAYDLEHLKTIH
jgi:hypothetical protein